LKKKHTVKEKWKKETYNAWWIPLEWGYKSLGDRANKKPSLWLCTLCDNVYSLDVNSPKKKQYNYSVIPKNLQDKRNCPTCTNKYKDLKTYSW
jgi:rubredoxin